MGFTSFLYINITISSGLVGGWVLVAMSNQQDLRISAQKVLLVAGTLGK
jgi:hypothetical protein